jgi:hypothetical protein
MKLDTLGQPRTFDSLKIANASVGIMSPVSQNGCFEFDRIIKAGNVVKRTRKTRVSTRGRMSMSVSMLCHPLTVAVLEADPPRPAPQLPLHLQGQG